MKEALIPAPGSQPRELNIFILSHVKCRKRFVVTENCVGQCTVFTAYIYTPRDFVEGYQSRTDIREDRLASSASCQNSVQSSFHLQYSGTTRAEWFCFTLQISTQHRYLSVGLEKCLLPDGNKEKLSDRIRFSRKSFDDTNSINVFATLKIDFTIYLFYSRQ